MIHTAREIPELTLKKCGDNAYLCDGLVPLSRNYSALRWGFVHGLHEDILRKSIASIPVYKSFRPEFLALDTHPDFVWIEVGKSSSYLHVGDIEDCPFDEAICNNTATPVLVPTAWIRAVTELFYLGDVIRFIDASHVDLIGGQTGTLEFAIVGRKVQVAA
jgi:hypothetical protein